MTSAEMKVADILKHLSKLKSEIEDSLSNNNIDDIDNKLNDYSLYMQDAKYFNLKVNYYFAKGELENAINVVEEGLIKHPFSYEMNYNAAILHEHFGNAEKCLTHYVYAAKYSSNDQNRQKSISEIDRIINFLQKDANIDMLALKELTKKLELLLSEKDGRRFPIDGNNNSLIRKVLCSGTRHEYMPNLYKSSNVSDINDSTRRFFKTELYKGKTQNNQSVITISSPSVIPVSLIEPSTKVEFHVEDEVYPFTDKPLAHNKYHYIRINDTGNVKIKSDKNIFVGNPIPIQDQPKENRLVLKIFIDGLSGDFIQKRGLENIMPNTYRFFEKGFIAENCYATSEWTLPSKASINTGLYSTNHRLLHPNYTYNFESNNKLMAEYFKEAGYFTAKIDSNWRTTPTFGYHKGFDRILFQNFSGGMDCRNVVTEAIEHLESFRTKNNFLSITFMDLHNVPDEIEDHLLAQVNTDISYRVDTNNKGATSVLSKYDENKINKYYEEIKRIDTFLGVLYAYLDTKYKKDEMCVVLHSDHGQTFLEKKEGILHDSRRKIPLMITGSNVNQTMDRSEFIEGVDILPIMLNCCSVNITNHIDGKLPSSFGGHEQRSAVVTQVIHPGQTYKGVLTDRHHTFTFETSLPVKEDLTVDLRKYSTSLIHNESGSDVSEEHPAKIAEYENIIFNYIKNFMDWNK